MFALYQTAGLFRSYSICTCVAITFYIFVRNGPTRGPPGVNTGCPLQVPSRGSAGGLLGAPCNEFQQHLKKVEATRAGCARQILKASGVTFFGIRRFWGPY